MPVAWVFDPDWGGMTADMGAFTGEFDADGNIISPPDDLMTGLFPTGIGEMDWFVDATLAGSGVGSYSYDNGDGTPNSGHFSGVPGSEPAPGVHFFVIVYDTEYNYAPFTPGFTPESVTPTFYSALGEYDVPAPLPEISATGWTGRTDDGWDEIIVEDYVLTVTGNRLDTVTEVTIGGASQPFTALSATELQITVTAAARSGPLVLTGPNNQITVGPEPIVRYRSRWYTPPTTFAASNYWSGSTGLPFPGGDGRRRESDTWATLTEAGYDFEYDTDRAEIRNEPDSPHFAIGQQTQNLALRQAWDNGDGYYGGLYEPGSAGRVDLRDPTDDTPVDGSGFILDRWTIEYAATGPDAGTLVPDGRVAVRIVPTGTRQTTSAFGAASGSVNVYYLPPDSPLVSGGSYVPRTALAALDLLYSGPTTFDGSTHLDADIPRPADIDSTITLLIVATAQLTITNPFAGDYYTEVYGTRTEALIEYQPPQYRYLSPEPPAAVRVGTLRRRQEASATGRAPRRRQIAAASTSARRGPGAAR